MAKNWIAGAIKHPGALTKKATKAGMSPMAFAHSHAGDSGTTGRQARLAETLQGLRSHLPKGVSQTPKGDLGYARGLECEATKCFKGGKIMKASSYFKKG